LSCLCSCLTSERSFRQTCEGNSPSVSHSKDVELWLCNCRPICAFVNHPLSCLLALDWKKTHDNIAEWSSGLTWTNWGSRGGVSLHPGITSGRRDASTQTPGHHIWQKGRSRAARSLKPTCFMIVEGKAEQLSAPSPDKIPITWQKSCMWDRCAKSKSPREPPADQCTETEFNSAK